MYIRVSVDLRNTKECSMSYRQSVMYKLTTYLKDLPLQSVSSKKNLQVVDTTGGRWYIYIYIYKIPYDSSWVQRTVVVSF